MPEIVYMLGLLIVIGATRSVPSISKAAPHWIVEQLKIYARDPARPSFGYGLTHDRMKPISRDEAMLEGISIEVAHDNRSTVTDSCLLF